MQMRFRLFVQHHQDGTCTIRVPAVRGMLVYGPSREIVQQQVETRLLEHLAAMDSNHWSRLGFYEHQELRPLSIEVQPKGKTAIDPIPMTLNLVITTDQHKMGLRYIVTAPRLEEFHIVVASDENLEEKTRTALAEYLRKWRSPELIVLAREDAESLDVLTLTVPDPSPSKASTPAASGSGDQEDVLKLCGLNLIDQSQRNRLGRADRRDQLVDQMLATLAADSMSSVLLVGEGDVGKTALVHEVVERIRNKQAPAALHGREVWFVTANNLIAGMSYTGEWQGRIQKLIAQVRRGRQILYMADPNAILDAGRWSKSDNNMGRFLRPYIESGELSIICECTAEGVEAGMRVEPSFMNAFRRIDVAATDEGDTQAILQSTARRLETARNLSITPQTIAGILDLTRRFMPYRAFPGKAVRFLDTMVRDMLPGSERSDTTRTLTRNDAITSFTQMTGLPAFILSDELALSMPEVRAYFEERLLGQPDAVQAMIDLITVLKAGLNDPNKPLSSFFFVGPTGVGKTELAKVLAEFLFGSRERMLRFDMSEYAAADALPKLIGSAWNRETEGELTRRVREQPFCVILLDELEKAHSGVFDALLSVLGEGRLSDASGRTADFRNAIIIMTSNLGASRRQMQAIGFTPNASDDESTTRLREHFIKEAEGFFRPEFFNRIDRIVAFRALTPEAIRLITRRELGKLLMREGIVRRNLLVEIDDAVIEKLLQQGFHPLYGARPLQREIERMVILPLAQLVVEQGANQSHLLRFSVRDDQIHLSFVPLDAEETQPEPLVAAPAPDRKLETDLAAVLRAIRELRERCETEEASPVVQHLRREASALLARTHEPTFWDAAPTARYVLSRIYHLERVLKRLDGLADRIEYVEEKGRQIRQHRDRRGVPQLARDIEGLAAEFAYVQMELAGSGAGFGQDHAVIRISGLGRNSEGWASQLQAMYSAWARRKGYEYTVIDPQTLAIQGSNVFAFLRNEAGLHRLNTGEAEDRERYLARLTVVRVPDDVSLDDPTQRQAHLINLLGSAPESSDSSSDAYPIVRIYNQGRHRYVRDPRTGVKLPNIPAVLEQGEIDAFMLAMLRQKLEKAN